MGLFRGDKSKVVEIKGHKLICPVCGGDRFMYRQTLLNTSGMTLLKLDWANANADNYCCGHCGYMFWFHP